MGFWAAAAPAIVAGGLSLAGSLFGSKKPPNPPDYDWIKQNGPDIWGYLKGTGQWLNENPYGLGEAKDAMMRNARDTSSSAYNAAQRNIDRNNAISGLSPAGGQASRQQYYAGQQYGEATGRQLNEIEIADFQAKEDQRQRGLNMLFSISNKSPIYSQIVAQNYWNSLNQQNQMWQNIGQTAYGVYDAYLNNQFLQQSPYNTSQGAASSGWQGSPYKFGGYESFGGGYY